MKNLTYTELQQVKAALDSTIVGAKIQKVFESDPLTIALSIRAPGETHTVLLSCLTGFARIYPIERKPKQPKTPSPFTMAARKFLEGVRIESVRLHDDIPILEIVGDRATITLNTWNAALFFTASEFTETATSVEAKVFRAHAEPDTTPYKMNLTSRFESVDEMPAYFETAIAVDTFEKAKSELRRSFKKAQKRANRLLKNVQRDLAAAADADQYRIYGELLQSAHGTIERGAPEASVPNYYADGVPNVIIPLDVKRDLKSNIARYFKLYKKYDRAAGQILERCEFAERRCARYTQAATELDAATSIDAIEALQRKWLKSKLISKKQKPPSRNREKTRLSYRTYVARSGRMIFVGKGSKDNDVLSTRVARGRDLWFHARDCAGSHVVLRLEKKEQASSEDLVDAALLAARFSKANKEIVVDVMYTEAKHVKKPKKAAPGLVTVAGGSNVTVRLDDPKLKPLLEGMLVE